MKCKTLSCCIVVKDGEKKVISFLDSIAILADEIVFVDTGSTDKTCDAIAWWVTKHNAKNNVKVIKVGSRFHDSDGDFNFGEAKTFAFTQATRDYVMWLDINDEVIDQREVKMEFVKHAHGDQGVYISLPTVTSPRHSFKRVRIGPREHSKMVGRIHEYMAFTNGSDLRRVDLAIPIKNFKENRNLDRNLRQLLKEWDREECSRTAFYIADTYRGLPDYINAIKWYRIRTTRFDWVEEFHDEHCKSLECIADLTLKLLDSGNRSYDADDVYDIANELIRLEPTRMEGYYYLARYYMHLREWERAVTYLRRYKDCRVPKNAGMWLNEHIYHGRAIINALEKCKTALKYSEVLVPEAISDLNARKGTLTKGSDQYEVNRDQTIF